MLDIERKPMPKGIGRFLVAPMVGLSHAAFRKLIHMQSPESNDTCVFTEMLSSRRIPSENLQKSTELKTFDGENRFIVQLLANEERFIEPSIKKLEQLDPTGFDINMGCPVRKTLKHNWGVRLMGDPDYAAKVVESARKHTTKPLSVKLRAGLNEAQTPDQLIGFCKRLESAGADWLTIHGRTKDQGHRGKANWELVDMVAHALDIPVVVNGGIQEAKQAIQVLESHKHCAGVMIARASTARPWILNQINQLQSTDKSESIGESGKKYFHALAQFIEALDETYHCPDFKKDRTIFFIAMGSKWYLFGHSFWKHCLKHKTWQNLKAAIQEYGEKHAYPIRTSLISYM